MLHGNVDLEAHLVTQSVLEYTLGSQRDPTVTADLS
jgi:hypothetical protein